MKETLQALPGVTEVNVDFGAKTATVTLDDPDTFKSDNAIKALGKENFKATVKSS